jgi:hypothetical protein
MYINQTITSINQKYERLNERVLQEFPVEIPVGKSNSKQKDYFLTYSYFISSDS